MSKSNKQINKEAKVDDTESSPAVVSYRLGQLERVVKEGFEAHNEKLESLTRNFATKEEISQLKTQLNDWRWYLRALVTAFLFTLGTAIVSLIRKG